MNEVWSDDRDDSQNRILLVFQRVAIESNQVLYEYRLSKSRLPVITGTCGISTIGVSQEQEALQALDKQLIVFWLFLMLLVARSSTIILQCNSPPFSLHCKTVDQ